MTLALEVLIVVGSVAAAYGVLRLVQAARVYRRFRGDKLISCPETHQPAAVRVAAGKAAMGAAVGVPELRISACSRWPERQGCPQECLAQIAEAPKACLVATIINQWYQGQECAYCHKPFGQIHWHDHPPGLRSKEGKTVQWNDIPEEKLQAAFATHRPVCWSCHVAETFRREHPEMVVDRPSSALRMNLYH
jgi:hypothetical protein